MLGNRYHVESVNEAYKVISKELLNAKTVSPRGQATKEIIAPQIIIADPKQRLMFSDQRKFNLVHALNESIMLFSNSDRVEHIAEFNKAMGNYSDDGVTMYGSYGKRISGYIMGIIDKLRADPDSRQAVLQIFASEDNIRKTKDVPCTSTLQFLLRDGKLDMITTMRSNDFIFGFQFDVVMFTMLQETIANTLGVALGSYVHQPGSLHVYEKYPVFNGYEMLEDMGTTGQSVSVTNASTYSQWKNLKELVLKEAKYTGRYSPGELKCTAKEIYGIIDSERAYRTFEDHKDVDPAIRIHFNNFYREAPEWAKPFVEKWVK